MVGGWGGEGGGWRVLGGPAGVAVVGGCRLGEWCWASVVVSAVGVDGEWWVGLAVFNGGLEELEILRALRAGTDPYSFGGGVC